MLNTSRSSILSGAQPGLWIVYEMVIDADEHFQVGSCGSVHYNECV